MKHCLKEDGIGSVKAGKRVVYSLRNKYNEPHITLDVTNRKGKIKNLFGKGNSIVKDKYIPYLVDFLVKDESWNVIESEYGAEHMAHTMMRCVTYCLENDRLDAVRKIMTQTDVYLHQRMFYIIDEYFNTNISQNQFEIARILGFGQDECLVDKRGLMRIQELSNTRRRKIFRWFS